MTRGFGPVSFEVTMTNNEHNEKVLAEISKHLEAIEELKATIKPADAVQEVSLEQCNAGAREAHFAKYAERERMKQAVATVLAGADEKPKKAVKNESAKTKAE